MHSVEAVFVCAKVSRRNPKIACQQQAISSPLFCPPQSPRPVDNSSQICCATQAGVTLSTCQAEMQTGQSGPSGKRWNGSGNAGYRIGAFSKRKRREQEEKVAAGKLTVKCGLKPHRRCQRRTGNRQQFGEPTVPRGRRGTGRQKPERNAFGHRTSKFRRSGRW